MGFGIIHFRLVTLQAQGIAAFDRLYAVHVMAIAAAHLTGIHFALGKRTVDIHLFQDLTVGKIQVFIEQARQHRIHQIRLGVGVVTQDGSPGMTSHDPNLDHGRLHS